MVLSVHKGLRGGCAARAVMASRRGDACHGIFAHNHFSTLQGDHRRHQGSGIRPLPSGMFHIWAAHLRGAGIARLSQDFRDGRIGGAQVDANYAQKLPGGIGLGTGRYDQGERRHAGGHSIGCDVNGG